MATADSETLHQLFPRPVSIPRSGTIHSLSFYQQEFSGYCYLVLSYGFQPSHCVARKDGGLWISESGQQLHPSCPLSHAPPVRHQWLSILCALMDRVRSAFPSVVDAHLYLSTASPYLVKARPALIDVAVHRREVIGATGAESESPLQGCLRCRSPSFENPVHSEFEHLLRWSFRCRGVVRRRSRFMLV